MILMTVAALVVALALLPCSVLGRQRCHVPLLRIGCGGSRACSSLARIQPLFAASRTLHTLSNVQDFLICIEMFFAALAHAHAFPPRDYMEEGYQSAGFFVNVKVKLNPQTHRCLERNQLGFFLNLTMNSEAVRVRRPLSTLLVIVIVDVRLWRRATSHQ